MAFTEKDVRYVADLAHLELTEEEVKKYLPQLDSILQYVEKLNELDTSAIEPMAQVTYPGSENASFRADAAAPELFPGRRRWRMLPSRAREASKCRGSSSGRNELILDFGF